MTAGQRDHRTDNRKRRLDLSVTQVAASTLATVVGAGFASRLGVYGTITGAAVVSGLATAAGAVFQHLFHRTGEHLRDLTTTSSRATPSTGQNGQSTHPAESVTTYRARASRRPKHWRRALIATVLTFAVAMSAVTVFELVTGKPLAATVSGRSGSGTTLTGGRSTGGSSGTPSGAPATDKPSAAGSGGTWSGRGTDGSGPAASASPSGGGASSTPTPSRAPSPSPSASPPGASTGASTGPSAVPSGSAAP